MANEIPLKSNVAIGVVPTHLKFVGGLVPDDQGRLPRNDENQLLTVANMQKLCTESVVKISCVQVPYFPGLNDADVGEMVEEFTKLGLETHFILMVGGADPMNPADEDAVAEILIGGLAAAKKHGVQHVSSTSLEEWMQGEKKTGADYDAAFAQLVKLHVRCANDAGMEGLQSWHLEFLRSGEMQNFTDVQKAGQLATAMNDALGRKFFRVLVDAAHCGDSDLSISENIAAIKEIAAKDAMGIFHASAKTTRGCLSTDDGWIGALMTAAAETGALKHVFVEVFHHEDDALQALRDLVPGHGVDTRDGRCYDQTVLDGVTDVARRLNNLAARGVL